VDIEKVKSDILKWIVEFVEQPNRDLAGWPPCPYARKARIDGTVDIRVGRIDPLVDLANAVMDNYEVIAYAYDPKEFTANDFDLLVQRLNRNFLSIRGLFALADHPESVETVNGVTMNQGTYAVVFLQDLSKLNHFARLLARQGYYNGWPEEYLTELFAGREDPRL